MKKRKRKEKKILEKQMERSNIILELVAKCTVYLHLRTRSSSIVPKLTSVQRLFEM